MAVADPQTEAVPTPYLEWHRFHRYMQGTWEQGDHVTVIAPTNWGKTTLMAELLSIRTYIAAFGVKGQDRSMEKLIRELGLYRTKTWQPDVSHRACLWPDIKGAGANHRKHQRDIFAGAMDSIYRSGGWCCFFDEVSYLSDTLKLDDELKFLLNQGRSSFITVVGCTQRPAFIPLAFYDQATHLFIGKDTDHRNVTRLSELTGNARKVVASEIPALPKYTFLYVNRDTGFRCRTKVEV